MNIQLRASTDADLEFLCCVYASTRQEELAIVPWTDEQKTVFLRQQFSVQHAYYQQHYTSAQFNVILVDERLAGRLYVDRSPKDIRIIDIALLPEFRNSGVGTRLIRELFEEADAKGQIVSIHVELNNPARRLYDRIGFVPGDIHGVYQLMVRAPAAQAIR